MLEHEQNHKSEMDPLLQKHSVWVHSTYLLKEESLEKMLRESPVRTPSRRKWWGVALCSFAMMVVVMWWGKTNPMQNDVPKCRPIPFSMLYARPGHDAALKKYIARSPQVLFPGDLIQWIHTSPKPFHVMVLGVNEKAKIDVFVPYGAKQSVRVRAEQKTLPSGSSLELDDSTGWERIFVVSSDVPFSSAQVKREIHVSFRQASGLRRMQLKHKGWYVRSWLIHKRHRKKR